MWRKVGLLVLVATAASRPALAQGTGAGAPPTAPSGPERAAALKAEGDTLLGDFRYADALSRYEEALALSGNPALLYNSGRALEMMGRYPEALERLTSFRARGTPELLAKVPNLDVLIADVEKHTTALTVEVGPAKAAGAPIRIGDRVVGPAPLRNVRVNAQKGATVAVELEGFEPESRVVDLPAGGSKAVRFELVPKDRAALLRVETNVPGAAVAIDGVARGAAPTELRLLAGSHALSVSAPDHLTADSAVELAVGERRVVTVELASSRVYTRWWFWTLIGTAVAGGAAAGTVVALNQEREADVGSILPGQVKVSGAENARPRGLHVSPIPLLDLRF